MRTTSVGYGQHPRRTAALVALGCRQPDRHHRRDRLVLAGPASAQPPTAAGARVPPHRTGPVEPSGAARDEKPGAMARAVPRAAGLGPARPVARSAPGASSPGAGP
jgi:hypothetical protein